MMSIPVPYNRKKISRYKKTTVSFACSQLTLFHSRKRWGIIYGLATVTGLFCIQGGLFPMATETDLLDLIHRITSLPITSFMIIVGMYVLNDLIDADLDRANGKRRPIPLGQVSKRQAWSFVILTNGIGVLLACLTLNTMSVVLASLLVAIGLMYSAPKISLKDRFVIKTLAIALALALCSLMGTTASFGIDLKSTNSNIMHGYVVLMLGTMVFITSPLNDLGDVAGDKAAGRCTIPIMIGPKNTVMMAILLAVSMSTVSWILYQLSDIGLVMCILVNIISIVIIKNMSKTLKKLDDTEFVRKQHKKSMPLHMLLQLALIVGSLLI